MMGLDLYVYTRLEKHTNQERNSDGDAVADDALTLYENPDFPGRAEGIDCAAVYAEGDGYVDHAGSSYSWYSRWREKLAKLAGYPAEGDNEWTLHSRGAWNATGGPFWELINFSDCEGTIGPVVSAKLAQDFETHAMLMNGFEDPRQRERFEWFAKAFKAAADGGAVVFG